MNRVGSVRVDVFDGELFRVHGTNDMLDTDDPGEVLVFVKQQLRDILLEELGKVDNTKA